MPLHTRTGRRIVINDIVLGLKATKLEIFIFPMLFYGMPEYERVEQLYKKLIYSLIEDLRVDRTEN